MITSTTWQTDTNAAFDVVIKGTPTPNGSGTPWTPDGTLWFGGARCVSPSGLWAVYADDTTTWDLLLKNWTIINGGGAVFFRGTPSPPASPLLAYSPYSAGFALQGKVWSTANPAHNGSWNANMSYQVTAIDTANPYTWEWSVRYWGSGAPIT